MSYEFRRGVRTKTSVIIALAGASGSGKTFTAILMAMGLAYSGMTNEEILATVEAEGKSRIAFIDTEGGRGLHYCPGEGELPDFKDTFPLEYAEIIAPYTPEVYQDAIQSADKAGFQVVIVDSASHEYESEGGIQEIADIAEEGTLKPGKTLADTEGQNGWQAWAIKPVKSPGNWKDAKKRHKKFVNRAVQARAHLIFCLRAEEKMLMRRKPKLDRDGNQQSWQGRPQFETEVVPAEDRPLLERWQPICEKRFMYEMTVSFLLLPSAPGVGHPIKNLQAKFVPMFPEGERMGRENGRLLAEWSHGRKLGLAAAKAGGAALASESTAGGGAKARATPEELTARYIAGLKAPPEGKVSDRDELATYQSAANKFLTQLRTAHPTLHQQCVDANMERYRELSPEEPEDDAGAGDRFPDLDYGDERGGDELFPGGES